MSKIWGSKDSADEVLNIWLLRLIAKLELDKKYSCGELMELGEFTEKEDHTAGQLFHLGNTKNRFGRLLHYYKDIPIGCRVLKVSQVNGRSVYKIIASERGV